MNERIKELKKQAWEYAMAVHDGHIVPPLDKEVWPMDKVFDEKFAELIVQDIINTALSKARWYQEVEKDDNTVMALCDLVKDIREEYGVE